MATEEKRYELRLYDEVLMRFSMGEDALGSRVYTVEGGDETVDPRMPLDLLRSVDSDSLRLWLEQRTIPRNRAFVKNILSTIGLHPSDDGFYQGVIDYCHGLSVNDAYWVVPEGFDGSWSQYNLYANDLDETLALVAYTGFTPSQKHRIGLSSEWSTGGTYPKAWRRLSSGLTLYKAGSEGAANTGNEPYSEWFAQQVADVMGIPHVSYGLERWEGRLASTCPLMNDEHTALVSWWQATGTSVFPETLAAATMMGPDILHAFEDMVVFDCIVMNVDRHATNFGLLRDNLSGTILGMAPLYDHNLALFPEDMETDFEEWGTRGSSWMPKWATIAYDRVLPFVLQPRHKDGLRSLLDFQFEQHPLYPVPETRLQALNSLVRSRAAAALTVHPYGSGEREQMLQKLKSGLTSMPVQILDNALVNGDKAFQSLMESARSTSDVGNQDSFGSPSGSRCAR